MRKCSCTTRNRKDGQILEEGITEAGSMASFTAAGTAYANYGVAMIPFFIYYSMFGFQRVGDLIWAFARRARQGLPVGGTAGRTTLAGEGLQHQDGHSILLASTFPPASPTIRRTPTRSRSSCRTASAACTRSRKTVFYYLTLYNENYPMPAMPEGLDPEGMLRGIYRFKAPEKGKAQGPPVRQRPDPERSAARAADSGGEVRRRRRRVERDQLQRAAPRRAGRGALEPPASGPSPQRDAVHPGGAEGRRRARSSRPPIT